MKFDILIVGAGLSGASLACALRGSRFRVGLLERTPPVQTSDWDTRVYAVSPVNVEFLQRCGGWTNLDPARVQAVERMSVYGDTDGNLDFGAYESGMEALAWIVESGRIACELWETARRQSNIEIICPANPKAMEWGEKVARVSLDDGRLIEAKLIVAADGANSWVREQTELTIDVKPYGEMGVVANFACEKPHLSTAFQWFRKDGVLAYLPLPGNQVSIVWSTAQAYAQTLLGLPPEALSARVAEAGRHRLGVLSLLSSAAAFPLRLMKVSDIVAPRLALIGDAAHTVHPLSGHGINLGFQDARVLADNLLSLPEFRDCGELAVLKRYARSRVEEVSAIQFATHGLNRLFKSDFAPLEGLRNLGLTATGRVPFLRDALSRYAAGLL
ncbi:MAG TPA: UbiH/UbiF family hydroxylase [Rhodocyclaceae bacterium]|nr:UbiH/UbiF family hydroxylase [Rhodocyclaceae bacterium]